MPHNESDWLTLDPSHLSVRLVSESGFLPASAVAKPKGYFVSTWSRHSFIVFTPEFCVKSLRRSPHSSISIGSDPNTPSNVGTPSSSSSSPETCLGSKTLTLTLEPFEAGSHPTALWNISRSLDANSDA